MELTVEQLMEVHLFDGISQRALLGFCRILKAMEIEDDHIFIESDAPTKDVYFILSGRVSIELGGAQSEFCVLSKGESVGEFLLAKDMLRTASARSKGRTLLAHCHRDDLMNYFDENPIVGYVVYRNLARVLVERLQQNNMLALNALR